MSLIAQPSRGSPQLLQGTICDETAYVVYTSGQVIDNLNIGTARTLVVVQGSGGGNCTINGVVSNSAEGRTLSILNTGSGTVTLAALAGTSSAANQFGAGSGNVLAAGQGSAFVWNTGSNNWTTSAPQGTAITGTAISVLNYYASPVTIPVDSTLNAFLTQSVAGGLMGTNRTLIYRAHGKINNNGNATTLRFQVSFGGQILFDATSSNNFQAAGDPATAWRLETRIANLGATNSQSVYMAGVIGARNAAAFTVGFGAFETPPGAPYLMAFDGYSDAALFGSRYNVDTTTTQTLIISAQTGIAFGGTGFWTQTHGELSLE